jgi:hypothetical protein
LRRLLLALLVDGLNHQRQPAKMLGDVDEVPSVKVKQMRLFESVGSHLRALDIAGRLLALLM